MCPLSGFTSPIAILRIVLLPDPATPKIALVSPRGSWKEIPSRTILSSNEMETSSNTMAAPDGCSAVATGTWSGREGVAIVQDPRITIKNRVTNTSTTIIRIIAATTASVVERPTPCVPPLVESP